MPPGTIKVVRGVVTPDAGAVRAVVKRLKTDIAGDPALAAKFKGNPRAVLAERGLSRDVQNELLVEMGRRVGGPLADCLGTCGCSGCCWTGSKGIEDLVIRVR